MSRLSDLIRQAKKENPQLGAAIEKEVRHLQERRSFGLNFERHQPESVDLYGRPVRRGEKVRMLPPRGETKSPDTRLWIVTGAKDVEGVRTAELSDNRTKETAKYPIDDLVVVAESNDAIYPGLVSTGRIERGSDKPFHTVINSENLHALKALLYTHRGRVDAIYIDPPYNTGNDSWIYSDQYVAADDLYRHSKWLAFLERRLLLARDLLKETGVIIVSIGDDEHHHLRMLLDQTLGAVNFISNVTWQGGRKNDSRYVSNGSDYMLIYARDERSLRLIGQTWREAKPGVADALAAAKQIWAECRGEHSTATRLWRKWMKSFKASGAASDAVTRFVTLDGGGRPIRTDGSIESPSPRPNLTYPISHPTTGALIQPPKNGWRYSRTEMTRRISEGLVVFGPDEKRKPSGKTFLDQMDSQVAESVFIRDRNPSGRHLDNILPGRRFPNPKDYSVLMRWLRLIGPSDAVVLDFFGGSGTTTESVVRLNEEDGGSRQCILVTNNEVSMEDARRFRKQGFRPGDSEWEERGVCRYVTAPRITTVVSGSRPDGSRYSEGLAANVEFFTLTYEAPLNVASNREFERVAPLLWLRAGCRGRRIEKLSDGWDVAETYGVIADLGQLGGFLEAICTKPDARLAFVVTQDERQFASFCSALPDHVEPVRLYESYLRNFQIDAARSSR